jgi:pyrroloquinoline quinone biosynthesis protein B
MKRFIFLLFLILIISNFNQIIFAQDSPIQIHVLGTLQDGGSPHIGCEKKCCAFLSEDQKNLRNITCLALVDLVNKEHYLFEATPDIEKQLRFLKGDLKQKNNLSGIFLTHAHIGHYSGLIFLGKEALDAQRIPVFAMPRMNIFLTNNGPWSQLIKEKNIVLNQIGDSKKISLTKDIEITPILVPHRDEFSETVGYLIKGKSKSALFLPDIDKWKKWNKSLIDIMENVDYAFIDATFYDLKEINYKDISEIPHPFVSETMNYLKELPITERKKVYFIHMNHTNPLLNINSKEFSSVLASGMNVAIKGMVFSL